MKLSDFIQDTLYEIAVGVEKARIKARNHVAINPRIIDGRVTDEACYVDFDVSIVVSENEQKSGSGTGRVTGEIKVASLGKIGGEIGGSGQQSNASNVEHSHRVSFKVPMYMNAHFRDNAAVQAEAERWENEGIPERLDPIRHKE
jgi:hypothetical protein